MAFDLEMKTTVEEKRKPVFKKQIHPNCHDFFPKLDSVIVKNPNSWLEEEEGQEVSDVFLM